METEIQLGSGEESVVTLEEIEEEIVNMERTVDAIEKKSETIEGGVSERRDEFSTLRHISETDVQRLNDVSDRARELKKRVKDD